MGKPVAEEILKPLKPFQRRTVEHAFRQLFLVPESTGRFLVADEVGLGKTLVARGIIARAIEHLWDSVRRIDVVYICSNHSIGLANLPKLQIGSIGGGRSFALATRLTMLATQLAPRADERSLADSRLNFVSFTPGTSFRMGRAKGQAAERAVLFHLLQPVVGRDTALMNLLQGAVRSSEDWRRRLREPMSLESGIREKFTAALAASEDAGALDAVLDMFRRRRDEWPEEARGARDTVVGKLRLLLAGACVEALEPDLVILDEFQRFKSLLETREELQDPGAALAQSLFRAETPEGNPVRTLLLSATPYKMYTTDAELEEEEHYSDFVATTRFLLDDDESRVSSLEERIARFGRSLKRVTAEPDRAEEVTAAKEALEAELRAIMARTERVPASDDRDAMVEAREDNCSLSGRDVREYLATDALFRAVDAGDPMRFWKSAPYLVHFMHGYSASDRLEAAVDDGSLELVEAIDRHASELLSSSELRKFRAIDPANAKLRDMMNDLVEGGLWRLLWIPPTLPYWPLEGPFQGQERVTKTLMFSAWNVVPDAVSAVLSYEAERRMMRGGRVKKYEDPRSQQGELLRLGQSGQSLSRHRLLWLLMPCLPLADHAHPLEAPEGEDRCDWVRGRVEALLATLPDPSGGEVDRRWEWAVGLVLDPGLKDFLEAWHADGLRGLSAEEALSKPDVNAFDAHVEDVVGLDLDTLGPRPPGLATLLTEVALGAPGTLACRAMKPAGLDDGARRRLAVEVAHAFWRLFNQPAVISLVRAGSDGHSDEAYWRAVLRYCREGNLQAVLDEQWHLLWEQHAWSEQDSQEETATKCVAAIIQAAPPTRSRVHVRVLDRVDDRLEQDELRLRTIFAQRFGHIRTEDGQELSQDAVRRAFNSPFRPFVLASTSIGQEGLDFHPWCHRLVHWDLPGNPVDLEQREGRVHRYKGHALRRNVVDVHGSKALSSWRAGDDIWSLLFDMAEEAATDEGNEGGLEPYWIAPGACRVVRRVPLLSYTREFEGFSRLKRQLAAYRVVLGQPRQEELVTLLDNARFETQQLDEWAVDLSPPG